MERHYHHTAPPPPTQKHANAGLNTIALVSGGKDSFFALLHCLANGHRVVALANLCPASPRQPEQGGPQPEYAGDEEGHDADLNSFMYQTVGHEVIPLYANVTGIPLYRHPIVGGAVQSARDYSDPSSYVARTPASLPTNTSVDDDDPVTPDETESMIPLLRTVMTAHPEADAISAGAILSTYQRTRVESVAIRLGLVPLAYLWKFPVLPVPRAETPGDQSAPAPPHAGRGHDVDDDAWLLRDMADVGLDARIVKVASGGLDESILWMNAASASGINKVRRAMRRFGGGMELGAVLGEGGEFETLVVDGPSWLFKKRIVVAEEDRRIVREGGGTAWLKTRRARVEIKPALPEGNDARTGGLRIPDLLDERFAAILRRLRRGGVGGGDENERRARPLGTLRLKIPWLADGMNVQWTPILRHWCVTSSPGSPSTVEAETMLVVGKIRDRLLSLSLSPSEIVSTVVILRRMSDFPRVNKVYGSLFPGPNPPSRVTVSCGDRLPVGCNIAIYLSVAPSSLHAGDRQGLHVQSRSYWAPANIGPYSQAISIFLSSLFSSRPEIMPPTLLVMVAGQIPLVPATMDLPRESSNTLELQLTLSLQHLWRIGVEMRVQWWTGVVVYFTSEETPGSSSMVKKSCLAAQAWREAHHWTMDSTDQDSDNEDSGPDLWDRKYNPEYTSFAGTAGITVGGADESPLPDWSVLAGGNASEAYDDALPPFFAAEVDELPRGAGVEWHAQLGLSHASPGRVQTESTRQVSRFADGTPGNARECEWGVHVTTVAAADGGANTDASLIRTVVALRVFSRVGRTTTMMMPVDELAQKMDAMVHDSLATLAGEASSSSTTRTASGARRVIPSLLYVDTKAISFSSRGVAGSGGDAAGCPLIACRSLWDANGQAIAAVAWYENVLERVS